MMNQSNHRKNIVAAPRLTRFRNNFAVSALTLGAFTTPLLANDEVSDDGIPFDEAEIFFELNHTDGDLGIHSRIDGDPWRRLSIEDPDERRMLVVRNRGRLGQQGLTELFFESAEPNFEDLAPDVFFRRFPEGVYEIEGVTLDGQELESESTLTHVLPAPASNVAISGQSAAVDCDADNLPSVSDPVVISWDAITTSHPELGRSVGEDIDIVLYQLVVEREEPSLLVLSMDLPPSQTEAEIPASFIALGSEFKFEILARESSGNQTAIESCFEIDGMSDGDGDGDLPRIVITADKQAPGNYGWVKFDDGEKQWVDAQCRDRLIDEGWEVDVLTWDEISPYPDQSPYLSCDDISDMASG